VPHSAAIGPDRSRREPDASRGDPFCGEAAAGEVLVPFLGTAWNAGWQPWAAATTPYIRSRPSTGSAGLGATPVALPWSLVGSGERH
jgi:hypothetical protein